jgi:hypothetical protein
METPASFEFTPQQIHLLENRGGEPVQVSVKSTNKVYLVIEQGVLPPLDEELIRKGLAHASAQVERGEVADWNSAEIKAVGRAKLANGRQES